MIKKYIYGGVLSLLFMGVVLVPSAHAETTSGSAMLEQIKVLMAKLEELQKQLATLRGEVRDVIKDGLREGVTDEDIKKIQEILATDSVIYPEGKVTGFFGPLTKEAVKRFQTRHGLEVTGVIDAETRDLLEEYLSERHGGKIPPGLLRAPGIMKKVEDRFRLRCDKSGQGNGWGRLCKKLKDAHSDDEDGDDHEDDEDGHGHDEDEDDEDEDEDDEDEDEDDNFSDVEVTVGSGSTTVTFVFDGDDYELNVSSTDLDEILDAVAN